MAQQPHDDPFADRPARNHLQFNEPAPSVGSSRNPSPYQSNVSLPQAHLGQQDYNDDEYAEKLPLTAGESFQGGFYPPG
jgi:chitin synthase